MKLFLTLLAVLMIGSEKPAEPMPVFVVTNGFNCSEGIIVADQIRVLVESDSLLLTRQSADSSYITVEITSYADGETSVINAGFTRVTPIQKNKYDYFYTRRLVTRTLEEAKNISVNILEKIHLIREEK
ncbi:MAG: hypothetical protein E4H13_05240 [Calditrichales bacterium]|nr:MAG: hypothetical protein E4H13_05240 [Calditrichales bacterium]